MPKGTPSLSKLDKDFIYKWRHKQHINHLAIALETYTVLVYTYCNRHGLKGPSGNANSLYFQFSEIEKEFISYWIQEKSVIKIADFLEVPPWQIQKFLGKEN